MTMDTYAQNLTANVPTKLQETPQWVCWRYETREGKQTKVPYNPATGRRADGTDPATWDTMQNALAPKARDNYAGIGFVFSGDDEYAGIDLDDCRDPDTGALTDEARKIIRDFATYTEVSPSGTGVKLFLRGAIPGDRKRSGNMEMYDRDRFFAVTGQHLDGTPKKAKKRQEQVDKLYKRLFPAKIKTCTTYSPTVSNQLSDDQLLAIARAASDGVKFNNLWEGDPANVYTSPSQADMALCSLLAFYAGPNSAEQIDRLFRQSGLYRDKWDREDYAERTIEKALDKESFYGAPNLGTAAQTMHSVTPSNVTAVAQNRPFTSLSEMLSRPRIERPWIVDRLFRAGSVSLLVARPKTGKSTFTRNLAVSRAEGGTILDRKTTQGTVLYFALDENPEDNADLLAKLQPTPEAAQRIHLFTAPAIPTAEELERHIEDYGATLVILDTLFKMIKARDGNSYTDVDNAITPLIRVAHRTNCHLHILHHVNKGKGRDIDAILGSTAIAGAVDVIMMMDEWGNARTIKTLAHRSGITDLDERLDFDPNTERLSVRPGATPVLSLEGKKQAIRASAKIALQGTRLNQGQLEEAISKAVALAGVRELIRDTIDEMATEGKISCKGRKPKWYSLPLNEEVTAMPLLQTEERIGQLAA